MREHIKFLKDPSKVEEEAIGLIKSKKAFMEFILSIVKMKKEKNQLQNIQKFIQAEKDFVGFVISTLKEIDSKIEIEEDEFDKIKQYTDILKYNLIIVFKNTKYFSPETIESIEILKQDLIKDVVELDIHKTLEDAIGHAMRLKVAIRNDIELLNQEIEKKRKFLNNVNKNTEEKESLTVHDISLQEISEKLKEASKEGDDKIDTIYRPIEIVNLYKITHKDEKLKDLNKYITYHWIYKVKALKTVRRRLLEILFKLVEKENMELEKRRGKK
ncbi:hypothetical protein [Sulfurihydrogenibium sp.]|jgi:hypothetical protein|uniref:hypothetical protein n=1 Tax=Sulfurihydrogenibium sp. TaxID=2053621 RepID=UPI00260B7389|nr:hypothetical protein [Sulfurihydrogenibium sp.]